MDKKWVKVAYILLTYEGVHWSLLDLDIDKGGHTLAFLACGTLPGQGEVWRPLAAGRESWILPDVSQCQRHSSGRVGVQIRLYPWQQQADVKANRRPGRQEERHQGQP